MAKTPMTRQLFRSGPDERRILFATEPVPSASDGQRRDAGLAEAFVERLHLADHRGSMVDVVHDSRSAAVAISDPDAEWRLWRYDAVVLVVGPSSTRLGEIRLRRRVLQIRAEMCESSRLILLFLVPSASRAPHRAARQLLADLAQQLRWEERDVTRLTADLTAEGALPSAATTADRLLATLLSPHDSGPQYPTAKERRSVPQEEPLRQAAVDRTPAGSAGSAFDLEVIARLACTKFGVPYGQVNLVDRGRLKTLAHTGISGDGADQPLCAITIGQDDAVLVPDTHLDHRCNGNPNAHGPDAVRFYAAHPIESRDGYRIGVVSVFDHVPHEIQAGDDVLLRDLAHLAADRIDRGAGVDLALGDRSGSR